MESKRDALVALCVSCIFTLTGNCTWQDILRGGRMGLFGRFRSAGRAVADGRTNKTDTLEQNALRLIDEGNAIEQEGRMEEAMQRYEAAVRLAPNLARAHLNLGNILFGMGKTKAAVDAYRTAVEIEPDFAVSHYNLGSALQNLGQLNDAVASYGRALQIKPEFHEAHSNLGNALKDLMRFDDAMASYRRALEIEPDFAEAHCNLGTVQQDLGQLDDAVASYRRALDLKPEFPDAHCNLGNALKDLLRFDEAKVSYRRALEIKSDFAIAHCNLGNVLQELGEPVEAAVSYRRALEVKPDFSEAHSNLGNTLKTLGQLDDAVVSYRRALQIDPDFAEAHYNLGIALKDLGQFDDAMASFRRALLCNPDYVEAHNNLGNVLKDLGQFDDAIASYRRALEIKPDFAVAYSNLLFALNYSASHTIPYCLDQARQYGQMLDKKKSVTPFVAWSCPREPERLRLGLVSGDMRNHPVGYFLESLVENLDASRVELIAYPTLDKADDVTAAIRSHVAAWKPLSGQSDEAAARLIHADGVHVLFDLAGHTADNRLPIFAWKPAPVQSSWLGYFATTGITEIDYMLGDPYVTPAEETHHFTERIWRLPDCYLCFTPPKFSLAVEPLPALSAGHITFGSFNNLAKINDAVVALWARVLLAVPGSRLFLKSAQLNDPNVCETTRQRFAVRGIASDRLTLEGSSPRIELLAAYGRVDIALDPFPYPGGTTSVEGLWMGVPVITRRGDRFLSHVGESIAHNAGLADWVAAGDDDYVFKAIKFTANPADLATLRASLRQRMLLSPLFNASRFARHFEAAVWGMWQSWQTRQGTSP